MSDSPGRNKCIRIPHKITHPPSAPNVQVALVFQEGGESVNAGRWRLWKTKMVVCTPRVLEKTHSENYHRGCVVLFDLRQAQRETCGEARQPLYPQWLCKSCSSTLMAVPHENQTCSLHKLQVCNWVVSGMSAGNHASAVWLSMCGNQTGLCVLVQVSSRHQRAPHDTAT